MHRRLRTEQIREKPGVYTDHQSEGWITASNVFGGITQRISAAELLETDQVGMIAQQSEEQVCFGLKAVVRTVVDHCGEIAAGLQNAGEVGMLRCG